MDAITLLQIAFCLWLHSVLPSSAFVSSIRSPPRVCHLHHRLLPSPMHTYIHHASPLSGYLPSIFPFLHCCPRTSAPLLFFLTLFTLSFVFCCFSLHSLPHLSGDTRAGSLRPDAQQCAACLGATPSGQSEARQQSARHRHIRHYRWRGSAQQEGHDWRGHQARLYSRGWRAGRWRWQLYH